jgi:hypothetical protein
MPNRSPKPGESPLSTPMCRRVYGGVCLEGPRPPRCGGFGGLAPRLIATYCDTDGLMHGSLACGALRTPFGRAAARHKAGGSFSTTGLGGHTNSPRGPGGRVFALQPHPVGRAWVGCRPCLGRRTALRATSPARPAANPSVTDVGRDKDVIERWQKVTNTDLEGEVELAKQTLERRSSSPFPGEPWSQKAGSDPDLPDFGAG